MFTVGPREQSTVERKEANGDLRAVTDLLVNLRVPI